MSEDDCSPCKAGGYLLICIILFVGEGLGYYLVLNYPEGVDGFYMFLLVFMTIVTIVGFFTSFAMLIVGCCKKEPPKNAIKPKRDRSEYMRYMNEDTSIELSDTLAANKTQSDTKNQNNNNEYRGYQ